MAQLLVRDVPDHIAAELKKRAEKNGRSAEAEHRVILEEALTTKKADAWAEIDRAYAELKESGRVFGDSTAMVRQDRDSR